MHKPLLICLTCLTLVLNAAGQEKTRYYFADQIQHEVTLLLLDKNIDDVTRQLESEDASTVSSLLRRLVIYERAGQTSRISKTLEALSVAENWECPGDYDFKLLLRNAAAGNIRTRRLYYERLCPDDINGTEEFLKLWSSNGDPKEIDAWLAKRSLTNDEWLMQRVSLRAKSGTAGELLDSLAAEIRANPSDEMRLDRYLKANSFAGHVHDVKWLADTLDLRTAGDYFLLGERLRHYSPQAGVKLLQKSLELPFTDKDAKLVDDRIMRSLSIGPGFKVNLEKQLRYWTKRHLAEIYQSAGQPLVAQPLVEELVSMKGNDILLQEVHLLAGAVQSSSGQRVVETKILGDEIARRSTSEYWLERARYYEGREEYGLERESYRQALVALVAKSDDSLALNERYHVVNLFASFLAEEHHEKEDQAELDKILTSELNSVPPETDYAFQIASLIVDGNLQLNTVRNSLLAKRPSLLTQLLAARREWDGEESSIIHGLVNGDEIPPELKEKTWSSLQQLVRQPASTRAFALAEAMAGSAEWQRAIPIWRSYIEHASVDSDKKGAIDSLFNAYCRTKQWRAAENLLLAQRDSLWRTLPNALAEIAVVAAQQNATDDAMRLWRMSTNLDRRNLETLAQLAQTNARPQLLAMYLNIKKEDPLSAIPDLALRLLR
ncbi:MAG TPA: hypothetical protein VFI24_13070 [Pyrinomonadaceae bacterium]|nr:hypothetical protein [Pyrinomonadaceae bacterium]